ncbi:MAG: hypothetical protein CO042_03355 [Parcubacteria group bacterium CG_4_9_14_0_2_um_filter_41_8]|nr:MAG: hypothetical protein AUJ34_00030 [Parcubacteria group bacterium CG1_02_41_12]PIZ82414.1 MAG: hypothetical protein COY02_00080 [Parcubacteria group bacterium CG_4_10_14_0_2_um_filter_41_6]PJC40521.1 MAG: hypothetical protein CO042_03355 [Parcubacteria group bacterium CG_4_9_14_0_2_um_filter_41_8]
MPTATKEKTINIPANGLTLLETNEQTGKAICEVNLRELYKINPPNMIDMMVAEAREEYRAGKTKGFTDVHALIDELKS